jgi:hypothetical protein
MNYISLGSTCSVAYQLQKLGLKKESLPFDWIRCPNILSVLQLISMNFCGFLANLTYLKDETKFPFIDDTPDDFDTITDKHTKIYYNNLLSIGFYHDFKEGVTIEMVAEKYQRRIKRFYELIKTPSIFIRDELKFNAVDIPVYNKLYDELCKYNSDNQLILIINTSRSQFDLTGLNPRIKIYLDKEKTKEWQHPAIVPFIHALSAC